MSLTRFEECWPLPTEFLPELPYNLNIVTLTLTLLANQLWCIDFHTSSIPLIIPQRLPALLGSLMPHKNRCSIHARWSKSSPFVSVPYFLSSKQDVIAYRSSKASSRPDCIFEIHQLWQSGFSRVYSTSCCNCWFEPEIIQIGQSSHNIYSNNILNCQESTIIFSCTKKCGNLLKSPCIFSLSLVYDFSHQMCSVTKDIEIYDNL